MTQRHQSITVLLLRPPRGWSLRRVAEAGHPFGAKRRQPGQGPSERGVGSQLSCEQLEEIHGGRGGIKEKVHWPLYDAF
jgi:hypothetical protein